MKQSTHPSESAIPRRLLSELYERFRLADKGVSLEAFEKDPALHMRNLSRRLSKDDDHE